MMIHRQVAKYVEILRALILTTPVTRLIERILSGKFVNDRSMGKFIFPKKDKVMLPIIVQNEVWEENEVQWLSQNVKSGDLCLNIGANVGYFTSLMSILSGERGRVIAVEPNKSLQKFFRINLFMHRLGPVEYISAAVGERNGSCYFYRNTRNYGDSRTFDPQILNDNSNENLGFDDIDNPNLVKMITIDSINTKGKRLDVILIDAQGLDIDILFGGEKRIKRDRPHILFEFTPQWLVARGINPIEALIVLKNWGYSLHSPELCQKEYEPGEIIDEIQGRNLLFINIELRPLLLR